MLANDAQITRRRIEQTKANIKSFQWLYEPFKRDRIWWVAAEMIRRLVLTSCIGLIGSKVALDCSLQLLAALLIAHLMMA